MTDFKKPEEFLERLPIRLSAKAFRSQLRKYGLCYEYRKQLMLTEAQFLEYLETLKVPAATCHSSSRKSAKSGTSTVRSTASEFERVRELIAGSTQKQKEKSYSAT